jgi:flagellar protein FliO/FliZ
MELADYLRFLFALLFVLGLIGLLAWAGRRFGMVARVAKNGGGKKKRVELIEVTPIDAKRRLVLIRRDDKEHLVLLGASADLLVEGGIDAPVAGDQDQTGTGKTESRSE